MSFLLAHLSDAHLANLRKRNILQNFSSKRVVGGFSWFLRRRHVHLNGVADAVQASVMAEAPDHVALTGDLVNIAAWNEFPDAATWVSKFGPAEKLTFVPGNHDAYVPVPWNKGLAHLTPWMKPDRHDAIDGKALFPIVRMRRNIALIGLNSGLPQKMHLAAGTVGPEQLRDLGHVLTMLGQQGFFRIVLIHHPPLPGLAVERKALTDAAQLKQVLADHGCELVLHGHNHRFMQNWLDTKSGPAAIIGAPSASISAHRKHENAGWNLFDIRRQQGKWQIELTRFAWQPAEQKVVRQQSAMLLPPDKSIQLP